MAPTILVPIEAVAGGWWGRLGVVDWLVWGAALLAFGLGDAATTIVGVRRYGLVEANPLVVRLAGRHPSIAATLAFKVATLAVGVACYVAVRTAFGRFPALAVPLLLLSQGMLATQRNLLNLLAARTAEE